MEAKDFIALSEKVDNEKGMEIIYNEILVPMFKAHAKKAGRKIRITDNQYKDSTGKRIREVLGLKKSLQYLIQDEMRPFLQAKGFKVIIWSPAYSVEVAW